MALNRMNIGDSREVESTNPPHKHINAPRDIENRQVIRESRDTYINTEKSKDTRTQHKSNYNYTKQPKLVDKRDVKDTLSSAIQKSLTSIETILNVKATAKHSTNLTTKDFKNFFMEYKERNESLSIAQRKRMISSSAPYLSCLQTVHSYMMFYGVVKLDCSNLTGAKEICEVLIKFTGHDGNKNKIKELNYIFKALELTDKAKANSTKLISYRYVRLFCIYVMLNDLVSASILANMILEQTGMAQRLRGGERHATRTH